MEHLKDTEKFIVYKKGQNLVVYISKLVSWIERFVFNRISKRVNWLLDRVKDGGIEIPPEGEVPGTDGSWRHRIVDGDWIWGINGLKQVLLNYAITKSLGIKNLR